MAASLAELASRNPTYAFAAALVSGLEASGVRHACIAPGSRSAPLAVCLAASGRLRTFMHVDERCAGFFALGLAKASREPVVLVCTSGTAAANFHPAVIEASAVGESLVVLTADRPSRLRSWGAAQTIDQVQLYGNAVRWFFETPAPVGGEAERRLAGSVAARAVAEARAPVPGPVHVNVCLDEPLHPVRVGECAAAPLGPVSAPVVEPDSACAASPELMRLARDRARVAVVAGPLDARPAEAAEIAAALRRLGWPLLAETSSGLRSGPHTAGAPILMGLDAMLRSERGRSLAPELVLRLGPPPTSKAFPAWLEAHPDARHVAIEPGPRFADPAQRVDLFVPGRPGTILRALAEALAGTAPRDPAWLAALLDEEKRIAQAAAAARSGERLEAPTLVGALWEKLPAGATLFVSNSRAIRDADAFVPVGEKMIRVLASRGANGIDGVTSMALGASAVSSGPLALLIGDLAFLHDAGGLLAAERHGLDATVLVVNDGGGSIFDGLPIAGHKDELDFESLFRVPHRVDLAALARAYGCAHARVTELPELRRALDASLTRAGVDVIEAVVDPRTSRVAFDGFLAAAGSS